MIGIEIVFGIILILCGMMVLSFAFFNLAITCHEDNYGDIMFIIMITISITCISGGIYFIGVDVLRLFGVI